MNIKIKKHFFLLLSIVCFLTDNAFGAREQVINSLTGTGIVALTPGSAPFSLEVEDQKRTFMTVNPNWGCWFGNKSSNVSVVLRFDDSKRNFDNVDWVLNVSYEIKLYNTASTPFAVHSSEMATINFKKSAGQSYTDVFLKTYEGALRAEVTITSVLATPSVGSPVTAVPVKYTNDIFFDLIQETERYYNFQYNGTNCTPTLLPEPIVTTSVTAIYLNQTLLAGSNNQLPIAWNFVEGAESYDVEWVFVDVASPALFTDPYNFDFSNATRVNVTQQHYEIPMAYPRGILIYRVRGVGLEYDQPFVKRVEGGWSATGGVTDNIESNPLSTYLCYYDGLDKDYNWQYSAAYAEDGKRKEVISYFDGSLRNRQITTVLNSENTAVVGETKYDFQGRPTVQMLPTPITNTGIHYNTNFNPGFNKEDFDIDGNYPTTGGSTALVPSTDKTANYYGTNSSATGTDAFVPDAQGVPYTQTRYKTDGTGRVIAQSGVGPEHVLGKHDTRYVYGTPTGQAELDRLFGNEVGNVSHYKKNLMVDANGQVSVTYLDQEGRAIATALAGDAPDNLLDIDGKPPVTPMVTDILTGKNPITGDSRISATTIVNSVPGNQYVFNYLLNLDTACFAYTLKPNDVPPPMCVLCNTCSFNLDIKVTDDEGNNMTVSNMTGGSVGFLNTTATCNTNLTGGANQLIHCTNIQTAAYSFTVTLPAIASYRIEKIITLSNEGILSATATFTDAVKNPPCGPFTDPVSPPPCNDCHYICNKMYGVNAPTYVTPTTPVVTTDKYGHLLTSLSTDDANKAIAEYGTCVAKCENPSVVLDECALKAAVLIRDMSPGGQYFDNLRDQTNTCSPPLSASGIDQWLDDNVLNTAVSGGAVTDPFWTTLYTYASTGPDACLSGGSIPTANRNWAWIRSNWNKCFAGFFIKYHPEYCNYKFYCGDAVLCYVPKWTPETPGFTTFVESDGTVSTASIYTITMQHSNLYDKMMYADANHLFTNPIYIGNSGSTPDTYLSDLNSSPATLSSVPFYNASEYYDPLLSSICSFDYLKINCDSTTGTGASVYNAMAKYLRQFYTANASGSPIYMSIWYVLDDPDGIASMAYGSSVSSSAYLASGTVLDNATIDFFKSFHGTGGLLTSGTVTKYDIFKSLYNGYKKFILYGLFTRSYDCPNNYLFSGYHVSTILPSDPVETGFTSCTSPPANSFGRAQIRFPGNTVFEVMLADCPNFGSSPAIATMLTEYGTENNCQQNCEGAADGWIQKIKDRLAACSITTVPPSVLASIKADLIAVCITGCDGDHPQGQSSVPSGYTGPPSPPASGSDFNTIISYYLTPYVSGCASFFPNLNIVHPPAPFTQESCTCEGLKTFAINNGITWNLSDPGLAASIAAQMNTVLDLTYVVSTSDVNYWLDACFLYDGTPPASVADLDIPSGHEFPDALICPASDEPSNPDPCGTEQAQADADYLNAMVEQQAVNAALFNFLHKYKERCLINLDNFEHMTASYDLDEYYYTLYYYDQAGNLIKTVPPEGVHPLPVSNTAGTSPNFTTQDCALNRLSPLSAPFIWPYHTMVTNYKYNTLNQIREQLTPDAGKSNFYYDQVGRLVISQNAKQEAYPTKKGYSYTLYDDLSRITEVGELKTTAVIDEVLTRNAPGFSYFMATLPYTDRNQITLTFYDEAPTRRFACCSGSSAMFDFASPTIRGLYASNMMENLRNRVSCVAYLENYYDQAAGYNAATTYYNNASHYSYDIHGNVSTLYNENKSLNDFKYDVNRIDYQYDLISGKVNEVSYNAGKTDQFHHRYEYDADNRITAAYTSRNHILWEKEAKYFYYKHGPLARVEIGDKQVQATDYAYTIHGWIKGINSTRFNAGNDIGRDGYTGTVNLNSEFANDAYSYSLGYYDTDYTPKNTAFSSFLANNALIAPVIYPTSPGSSSQGAELFNGNIANMSTNIYRQTLGGLVASPQLKTFRYDQLNRIKSAYTSESFSHNSWDEPAAFGDKYLEKFAYDMNGNINTLQRYDDASALMDNLTYSYTPYQNITPALTPNISYRPDNKLRYVMDPVTTANTSDIEDQPVTNYDYDNIGNLIKDESEKIANIEWTVYGKIKKITRSSGTDKPDLEFVYDAQGNRIEKIEMKRDNTTFALLPSTDWERTYYVRDAQGNVMVTYKQENISGTQELFIDGQQIYGSSRIGILNEGSKRVDVSTEINHYSDFETSGTNGWGPVSSTLSTDTKGRLKVDLPSSSLWGGTDLYPTVSAGKTYEVSFDIDMSEVGSNSLWAIVLDYTVPWKDVSIMVPLNGHNSYRFTAWSPNTIIKFQNNTATNNAYNFYLDNIVIKEVNTGRTLGDKTYEQSNHLGNVLTVLSDRKLAIDNNADAIADSYMAEVLSATDYYSFGSPMPGRQFNTNNYRYGFNGKENDRETIGTGEGTQDYGMRIYNPSIGRFLSVDPLTRQFSHYTPYQFAGNSPIFFIDLDGSEETSHPNYKPFTFDLFRFFGWNKPEEVKEYFETTDERRKSELRDKMEDNKRIWSNWCNTAVKTKTSILTAADVVLPVELVHQIATGQNLDGTEATTADFVINIVGVIPMGKLAKGGKFLFKAGDKFFDITSDVLKYFKKINPCGCFTKSTKILTDKGLKEIKDLIVGDTVWSYNQQKNITELRKVTKVFHFLRDSLYTLTIKDEKIETTADHPFYVNGIWKEVRSLNIGDKVKLYDGDEVTVENIEIRLGEFMVYNFEVEGNHNYFVSQIQVLVHNSGPCDFGFTFLKQKATVITDVLTKGIHGNVFHKGKGIGEVGFELAEDGNSIVVNVLGKPSNSIKQLLNSYGELAMKQEGFYQDLLERVNTVLKSGQISEKSNRFLKLTLLKDFLEKTITK